jgi:hypothetical protein
MKGSQPGNQRGLAATNKLPMETRWKTAVALNPDSRIISLSLPFSHKTNQQ